MTSDRFKMETRSLSKLFKEVEEVKVEINFKPKTKMGEGILKVLK